MRNLSIIKIAVAALMALTVVSVGGLADETSESSPYGVNAHDYYGWPIERATEADIDWLRCDFSWKDMEPAKHLFYWDVTDLTVQDAVENGYDCRVLGSLGHTPGWANNNAGCGYLPDDPNDWVDFVTAVVGRYKDNVKCWGIWNEPHIYSTSLPPEDTMTKEQYIHVLLIPAYNVIKAIDPNARVVAPAVDEWQGGGTAMVQAILQDAGEYIDVVDFHCYPNPSYPWRTVLSVLDGNDDYLGGPSIHQIMLDYPDKEFWLTEVGYRNIFGDPVTEQEQAEYLYLLLQAMDERRDWWQKTFWYELKDDPRAKIPQHGLLADDGREKPAYRAYRDYITIKSGNYIVIDDMESYDSNFRIYDTWKDGCGDSYGVSNGTGSCVWLATDPVHGGQHAMAFAYDNNDIFGSEKYSEIQRQYDIPRDWTVYAVKVLTLYFYGDSGNDANEQVYAGLEDSNGNHAQVAYGAGQGENMDDIKLAEWQEWNMALADFTDVNLASIRAIYIGFGDRDNPLPGGSGIVHFDDIRLYPCRSGGLVADLTGNCVVDYEDLAVIASQWLAGDTLEADLYEDCTVDFKDYSLWADSWLKEQLWVPDDTPSGYEAGLAWVQFHSPNFMRPAGVGVDSQVDIDTGTSINDYSRIWLGWLKLPTNTEVTVEAEADDGLHLWLGDECIIDGWYPGGERVGTFTGEKDALLPLRLEYYQDGGVAFVRLYWSWACKGRELIPASAFFHTESDAAWVQDVYDGNSCVHEDKSSIYEPASEARRAMPIRPGPHLFIGDYLIKSSQNIVRQVEQPQRDSNIPNPLVTGLEDRNFQPYLTVLTDTDYKPNCFRIWYNAHTADFDMAQSHIGYMESADGINWVRPTQVLDPFPIQFGCAAIDMGPDYPNLPERYKYGYYYSSGLHIGISADGLAWQPLVSHTVLHHNHDITGIFRDPLHDCYVATTSVYITGNNWTGTRRVTMQSFSDDLIHWQVPWYVLTPHDSSDEGQTQFYAMDGFLIRGPLKIGMVKVLRDDLVAEPPVDPTAYGIGYTTLAWTLDGEHWVRDQQVFFDRDHSTDPIPWDHAHAWIDEQLIVDDEVYLYYGGYKQGHKVNRFEERQIGLVKMPLDRYVARVADGVTPGILTTIPLLMDNQPGRLVVNTDASVGQLRIQVRDANSNTILEGLSFGECTPITSNGLRLEVRWWSEEQTLQKLAALADQSIRLEFELTNAKIYAFAFIAP